MATQTVSKGWKLTARILSVIMIIGFLYYFVTNEFTRLENMSIETGPIYFMIFSVFIGFIVSWFFEMIGGLVLVVGGFALGVYAFLSTGGDDAMTAVIYTVPFVVPGFLFLVSWFRRS
ncbi:MAG: hypothetical protein K9J27_10140 [Bacteroidales bacterium]|nr:hypothetical protein [Bacteroidales bacterium]MCF8334522.1 hypothetical protein [Bacteroidales bacterium]